MLGQNVLNKKLLASYFSVHLISAKALKEMVKTIKEKNFILSSLKFKNINPFILSQYKGILKKQLIKGYQLRHILMHRLLLHHCVLKRRV